jgi:TRAP transporter 4TM/12TM fusion protein
MASTKNRWNYQQVKSQLVDFLGLFISLFIIYTVWMGQFSVPVQRGTILMLGSIMILLSRNQERDGSKAIYRLSEGFSFLGIAVIVLATVYIYFNWFEIAEYRQGMPNQMDILVYLATILVVFEVTRRSSGKVIPIVALAFILYLFAGPYLPGALRHSSVYWVEIVEGSFGITGTGIYGLVLSVMIGIIYIFIIYGAFLKESGAGDVFVKLAYITMGRLRGGPAQTAIVSSTLFGSISGSPPANVMATGNFTIPLMKKVGYRPEYAAAVEACASTVGQKMPPVMGVSAFIMSEVTGIPYLRICLASLLPAILGSMSLMILVYLEAQKSGITSIPKKEIPQADRGFFLQLLVLVISLGTLIYLLVAGYSPAYACLFAIIALVVGSYLDVQMRMTPRRIIKALTEGAKSALSLLAICALIGVVLNAINSTGIGLKFSQIIIAYGQDSLLQALFITMFASLVLGMGLPTVPAYLMVVLVAGSALSNLGVETLIAHLFVLYYAVACTITPPVCLSSFTAAGIAKSNPMRTGFVAFRFGLVILLVPFIMVYNPAISFFADSYWDVAWTFFVSVLGVVAFVASERGYIIRNCSWLNRAVLIATALAMFSPYTTAKLFGIGGFVLMLFFLYATRKSEDSVKLDQSNTTIRPREQ